jgi:hypothetical protein
MKRRLQLSALLAAVGVHMPTLPARAQPVAQRPRRPQEVVIEHATLPETRQQRRKSARDQAKRERRPR